jgi:hypothetical protein
MPQPMGSVLASAGETWYAQSWHRDVLQGMATSNFTGATSIELR